MRITIIGATGHIGTYLVPRLIRSGHEVTAINRGRSRPYDDAEEWRDVKTVHIDREAAEHNGSFGESIASLGADVLIDLICFTRGSAMHLVDALRDRVGLLIHCGTLWVHGIPRSRPYDETALREPIGEYAIKKAEIEAFLLDEASKGFPVSMLHPGHITGRGWPPINPAGNLDVTAFERLSRGERITLPDDGQATLQHVHADDVAQAFALAIDHRDKAIGEAFHVAACEPVTMIDYAKAVASWHGREANIELLPWEEWKQTVNDFDASITLDHVTHSPWASIAKAERLLGFNPRFSAVEAVRDALYLAPQ
ncbi:MAG TPA: NAD-dependent epimerase/dehydratase family protein [Gemmatimonadaceae bacterium]|nr:NAD-dependent epimerase/dehydratase family protein [Gemmatimonadaceae bacterium]